MVKIATYNGNELFAIKREDYIKLSEEQKNDGSVYMITDKVGFPLLQRRVLIGWTYNNPRIMRGLEAIKKVDGSVSDVEVLGMRGQKQVVAQNVIMEKRKQTQSFLKEYKSVFHHMASGHIDK